jgi:hypothetical protein
MIDPLDVYDYGFVFPEGTEFDAMPKELKNFLEITLEAEWPKFPAIGTQFVSGYGLCLVRMKAKLTKEQIDDLILYFGVPWRVAAIRSAYKIISRDAGEVDELGNPITVWEYDYPLAVDKAGYLNYCLPVLEESSTFETPIYRQPTMADTIIVPMIAGTDGIVL